MVAPEVLGSRLLEARIARGYRQQRLSQEAQVSQAQISKLERGTISDPGMATLAALAGALRLSVAALLGDEASFIAALATDIETGLLAGISQLNHTPVHAPVWLELPVANNAILGSSELAQRVALQQIIRATERNCPVVSVSTGATVAPPNAVTYSLGLDARIDLVSLASNESIAERKSLIQQFLGVTFKAETQQATALGDALDRLYAENADNTVPPTLARLYHLLADGGSKASRFWARNLGRFFDGGDLGGALAVETPLPHPKRQETPNQFWDCSRFSDGYFRAQLMELCVHNVAKQQMLEHELPLLVHVAANDGLLTAHTTSCLAKWMQVGRKYNMAFTVTASAKNPSLQQILPQCSSISIPAAEGAAGDAQSLAPIFGLGASDLARLDQNATAEMLYLSGRERGWLRIVETQTETERIDKLLASASA
jgi:transcriptional regulator with XRE-family HTH domain